MRRVWAVLGTAVFLVVAPGMVAGVIPWWISGWHVRAPFLGFTPFRTIGIVLFAAGIPVLVESFGRFALQGLGTPAPVFPTERLVVKGFYRYVRSPMCVSVLSVILGQVLVLSDTRIVAYAVFSWLAMTLSPLESRGRKDCKVAVTKLRDGRKINGNPEKGAVGMGLDISPQTEARIRQEAERKGISVEALLERLMSDQAAGTAVPAYQLPELPVLHLGPMGPLHRRDIYDDVR